MKTASYTLTVGEFTLDALKDWVNANNRSTRYYGYYVGLDGSLHRDYTEGDVGRIGYYAARDVDDNVSGSRILVLALNDVGSYIWGGKGTMRYANTNSGYYNTMQLQAYGSTLHPAAYAAWNYWADQPEGASNWFLPSIQQWTNMMVAAQMSGEGSIAYGTSFWSSMESSETHAWSVTASGSTISRVKDEAFAVRPCFAY